MVHFLFTSLILCSMALFSLQDCKGPITNECGCILRHTFTTEWLQLNYPDIAAAWPKNEFTAPTATYPKCGETGEITFTCPTGQSIIILYVATNKLGYDERTFPNPTVLQAECDEDDRHWYTPGLTSPIDDTFNTTSIACTVKA